MKGKFRREDDDNRPSARGFYCRGVTFAAALLYNLKVRGKRVSKSPARCDNRGTNVRRVGGARCVSDRTRPLSTCRGFFVLSVDKREVKKRFLGGFITGVR